MRSRGRTSRSWCRASAPHTSTWRTSTATSKAQGRWPQTQKSLKTPRRRWKRQVHKAFPLYPFRSVCTNQIAMNISTLPTPPPAPLVRCRQKAAGRFSQGLPRRRPPVGGEWDLTCGRHVHPPCPLCSLLFPLPYPEAGSLPYRRVQPRLQLGSGAHCCGWPQETRPRPRVLFPVSRPSPAPPHSV